MARPRGEKKEQYYAWTELRNGGKAEKITVAGGRGERFVVTERYTVAQGEKVSQSDLGGIDDETWESWVAGGSVRPYPMPDGVDEYTSPSQAFLKEATNSKGEIDIDKLMELGLTNPAPGGFGEDEAESEDDKEVTQPVGA